MHDQIGPAKRPEGACRHWHDADSSQSTGEQAGGGHARIGEISAGSHFEDLELHALSEIVECPETRPPLSFILRCVSTFDGENDIRRIGDTPNPSKGWLERSVVVIEFCGKALSLGAIPGSRIGVAEKASNLG